MNNQAAQTMPERALAAWTGKHRTDAENRAFLAGYETCQSDMLAAAPAASGGESAASVSERAIEILAGACLVPPSSVTENTDSDVSVGLALRAIEQALTQPLEVSGDQVVLVGYKSESGEDCSAFLTASRIGQLLALTQQRGEAAAHASGVPGRVTDALVSTVEAAMHACYMDHDDYRLTTTLLHDMAVAAVKAVGTTPHPSADAVREVPDGMVLVPREPTPDMVRAGAIVTDHVTRAIQVYSAMLSAASDHQQNAAQGGGEK